MLAVQMDRLFAKSWIPDDHAATSHLLHGHLADVLSAAEQILAATGEQQLAALGINSNAYQRRFMRIVRLAAALHDLGKANDHFQAMLRERRVQALRHEWVSLLMVESPDVTVQLSPLRKWFLPALDGDVRDWHIVLWAITGHHPGFNRQSPPRWAVEGTGTTISLLSGHADFACCLQWLAETFSLDAPPACRDVTASLVEPRSVFTRINDSFREGWSLFDDMDRGERALVAAAKACVIGADVAGSALPRHFNQEEDRRLWISEGFRQCPSREDLDDIVRERLKCDDGSVNELHDFQLQVASSSSPVTLVRAGCGTGKTVAAYAWAAHQYPGRRLYFCYPTTGTATEGFRDYLFDGSKARSHARLFHGRDDIDLDMLGVKDEPSDETLLRVESLEAWSTPIVSCTVDTVLGLLQNHRRGLYAWPALANAVFVFDEIHAYDDRLFAAFLRFLLELPTVPVLLMTASLPRPRLVALKETVRRRGCDLPVIPSHSLEAEQWKRYRRETLNGVDELTEKVARSLALGEKILWVVNTVNRVLAMADRFSENAPLLYHSRFRYTDRVQRHTDVINAFRQPGAVLAICTQVAEMSLDLSADLLIMELAPVPALIQRLGRLNRRATSSSKASPFVVVHPDSTLPYNAEDLAKAKQWLDKIGQDEVSQQDLASSWQDVAEAATPTPVIDCKWLDGGPSTEIVELRTASPGISVLLPEDAASIARRELRVVEAVIPMPPTPLGWTDWKRVRGIPVVPEGAIEYDPRRGAAWRK